MSRNVFAHLSQNCIICHRWVHIFRNLDELFITFPQIKQCRFLCKYSYKYFRKCILTNQINISSLQICTLRSPPFCKKFQVHWNWLGKLIKSNICAGTLRQKYCLSTLSPSIWLRWIFQSFNWLTMFSAILGPSCFYCWLAPYIWSY